MAMIITTYRPDGTKERKPIGYTGGACNIATAPYERLDVPGSVLKTPTGDACKTQEVAVVAKATAGA